MESCGFDEYEFADEEGELDLREEVGKFGYGLDFPSLNTEIDFCIDEDVAALGKKYAPLIKSKVKETMAYLRSSNLHHYIREEDVLLYLTKKFYNCAMKYKGEEYGENNVSAAFNTAAFRARVDLVRHINRHLRETRGEPKAKKQWAPADEAKFKADFFAMDKGRYKYTTEELAAMHGCERTTIWRYCKRNMLDRKI